jgi:hypothetical protein
MVAAARVRQAHRLLGLLLPPMRLMLHLPPIHPEEAVGVPVHPEGAVGVQALPVLTLVLLLLPQDLLQEGAAVGADCSSSIMAVQSPNTAGLTTIY